MNTIAERANRLRKLRKLSHLSRNEIAKRTGIGLSTLQFWEEGKGSGITLKGASQLIHFYNSAGVLCSLDWLMENIGMEPILKSQISAYFQKNNQEDSFIQQEISLFLQQYKKGVSLMISDDSMLPLYQSGDFVAGEKKFGQELRSLINMPCIVESEHLSLMCRILKRSEKKNCFDLTGSNPFSHSKHLILKDVKVISAAKVVWHRKPS